MGRAGFGEELGGEECKALKACEIPNLMLLPSAWRWGSVGLLGVGDSLVTASRSRDPQPGGSWLLPGGETRGTSRQQSERERLVLT